jgi:hypothetical protein
MNWRRAAVAAAIILGSGIIMLTAHSCKKNPSITGHTLYDSLGGTALVLDPLDSGQMIETGYLALRTISANALSYMIKDSLIDSLYFSNLISDLNQGDTSTFLKLTVNVTNYLAVATGAQNTAYAYHGLSMSDAHNPALNPRMTTKVDSASFDAFVHDVALSCTAYGISNQLISRIGTLLYSVEGQVVQK